MSTFTMKQATHSGPDAVSGQVIGELINLGGRQRMLSQRIVLHVLLASLGNSDALSVAKACLATFAQAHTDLVSGNEWLPGVFSEALRELYFGNRRAEERIQQFIAQANRAVSWVESGRAEDRTQVEALVIQATPLLELLQDITLAYQHEMRGTEAAALKRQTDIAGIRRHWEPEFPLNERSGDLPILIGTSFEAAVLLPELTGARGFFR